MNVGDFVIYGKDKHLSQLSREEYAGKTARIVEVRNYGLLELAIIEFEDGFRHNPPRSFITKTDQPGPW